MIARNVLIRQMNQVYLQIDFHVYIFYSEVQYQQLLFLQETNVGTGELFVVEIKLMYNNIDKNLKLTIHKMVIEEDQMQMQHYHIFHLCHMILKYMDTLPLILLLEDYK